MNKITRWLLIVLSGSIIFLLFSWFFTTTQLASARARGTYPSAEDGMLAVMKNIYTSDLDVEILYAGPNDLRRHPHVWYVIAEVHASARKDGQKMRSDGCDAPGVSFIQVKDGTWLYFPNDMTPLLIGSWMEIFNLAGPGQEIPAIDLLDWTTDQNSRFCS